MTELIRNEKLQPDTVDEIAAASGIVADLCKQFESGRHTRQRRWLACLIARLLSCALSRWMHRRWKSCAILMKALLQICRHAPLLLVDASSFA